MTRSEAIEAALNLWVEAREAIDTKPMAEVVPMLARGEQALLAAHRLPKDPFVGQPRRLFLVPDSKDTP